jgi:predicted nucleic acid-binding Zn ribbon protein
MTITSATGRTALSEYPSRDTYVTANGCPICGIGLQGRSDRRYCSPACRQTAYRARTSTTEAQPQQLLPAARPRREHTIYECTDCEQRLAAEQWCPDCQQPARRIGPGGSCPACGDPVTIAELMEVATP